jgi:hypothetical protein
MKPERMKKNVTAATKEEVGHDAPGQNTYTL